jgi:hypothetical protein
MSDEVQICVFEYLLYVTVKLDRVTGIRLTNNVAAGTEIM